MSKYCKEIIRSWQTIMIFVILGFTTIFIWYSLRWPGLYLLALKQAGFGAGFGFLFGFLVVVCTNFRLSLAGRRRQKYRKMIERKLQAELKTRQEPGDKDFSKTSFSQVDSYDDNRESVAFPGRSKTAGQKKKISIYKEQKKTPVSKLQPFEKQDSEKINHDTEKHQIKSDLGGKRGTEKSKIQTRTDFEKHLIILNNFCDETVEENRSYTFGVTKSKKAVDKTDKATAKEKTFIDKKKKQSPAITDKKKDTSQKTVKTKKAKTTQQFSTRTAPAPGNLPVSESEILSDTDSDKENHYQDVLDDKQKELVKNHQKADEEPTVEVTEETRLITMESVIVDKEITIKDEKFKKRNKEEEVNQTGAGKDFKNNSASEVNINNDTDSAKNQADDKSRENSLTIVDEYATKKPSAHNIANGFAVDRRAELHSDNEDIKERLNKLLRGEL